MTIPLPQLDQRTWEDLLREGLARIPRRAPEWTDHNLHDPGITLIELLAYKTDQLLYHSNRVSQRLLRNVHGLIGGSELDTPTSVLWFSGVNTRESLGKGQVFDQLTGSESKLYAPGRLRLREDVHLYPLTSIAVEIDSHVDQLEMTQRLYSGSGFVLAQSIQQKIVADNDTAGERLANSEPPRSFKRRLFTITLLNDLSRDSERKRNQAAHGGEAREERLNGDIPFITLYFDIDSEHIEPRVESIQKNPASSPLRWRYANENSDEFTDVSLWYDETTDLSRTGIVRLAVGETVKRIQCDWEGDFPWPAHRVIRRIVPNVVRTEHALSVRDTELEFAPSRVNDLAVSIPARELPTDRGGFQTLEVKAPFTAITVIVGDQPGEVRKEWTSCSSLLAKGKDDACFEIEGTVLRFGNGKYGAKLPGDGRLDISCNVLQPTQGISIGTRWKPRWNPASTSDEHVNQQRNAIERLVVSTIEVPSDNPVDDIYSSIQHEKGKLDASHRLRQLAYNNEGTLDGLSRKHVLAIPAPKVAVTPTDYERLALETPGVCIMRARAVAETDVYSPGLPGHGTISVIVLPDFDFSGVWNHPAPSTPHLASSIGPPKDRDTANIRRDIYLKMRRTIQQEIEKATGSVVNKVVGFLSLKQTIGTRLVVTTPKLAMLRVDVTVTSIRGDGTYVQHTDLKEHRTAVEREVKSFFDPFTGGNLKAGYPWRTVSRGELMSWLNTTEVGKTVIDCSLTYITKSFPWSMPYAVVFVHDLSKREEDAS